MQLTNNLRCVMIVETLAEISFGMDKYRHKTP